MNIPPLHRATLSPYTTLLRSPKEYEAIIKPSEQRAQHIIKKYPKLKYISFLLTGFFGLHRLVRGLLIIVVIFSSIMSYLERSEEHTSELQSRGHLVCRLLLEK